MAIENAEDGPRALERLHQAVEKVLYPKLAEPIAQIERVTVEVRTELRVAADSYRASLAKIQEDHRVEVHSIQQKEVAARVALAKAVSALEALSQRQADLVQVAQEGLQEQIAEAASAAGEAQSLAFGEAVVQGMEEKIQAVFAHAREQREVHIKAVNESLGATSTKFEALIAKMEQASAQANTASAELQRASHRLHWKNYLLAIGMVFAVAAAALIAGPLLAHLSP